MFVRACVRAYVRVHVCVCVRARARACVCVWFVRSFFHVIHTEQLAADTQIIQADTEYGTSKPTPQESSCLLYCFIAEPSLVGNVALTTETTHACPFQFFMKNVYE